MGDLMTDKQSYEQKLALADAQAQAESKEAQQAIANDWRVSLAQALVNKGKSQQEIYEELLGYGASDEDMVAIFNAAGIAK